MLQDLITTPPRTEPQIKIYKNYISLNGPAVRMLGIVAGDAVSIMKDDRDGYIYVAKCSTMKQSRTVTIVQGRAVVSSVALCRELAKCLDGFGTYKICKEESQEYMGYTFYNIFKKKYGKG